MEVEINGARIIATYENVPLFGTVTITQTLIVSWLILILISALFIWLGSGLKVTGISRKQAVAETIYTSLVKFVRGNMGPDFDRYIPLVGTIFVTSIFSNLISLVVFVLITYHKIKASGIGAYLKSFLDPLFILLPINIMSELFTPVSMACRHFGNILSGTVISALIYAALVAANSALFHLLASSMYVALVVTIVGLIPLIVGFTKKKKKLKILGIIVTVLGVLAILTCLGVHYPWLTIGIPAIPSLYFDWFSGCIQAFIFCTLTTLFIKQAAG